MSFSLINRIRWRISMVLVCYTMMSSDSRDRISNSVIKIASHPLPSHLFLVTRKWSWMDPILQSQVSTYFGRLSSFFDVGGFSHFLVRTWNTLSFLWWLYLGYTVPRLYITRCCKLISPLSWWEPISERFSSRKNHKELCDSHCTRMKWFYFLENRKGLGRHHLIF